VEELDKIADKFARDDKGPQPAVTDYRGMATGNAGGHQQISDHALQPG
jgi:hypothetical protein